MFYQLPRRGLVSLRQELYWLARWRGEEYVALWKEAVETTRKKGKGRKKQSSGDEVGGKKCMKEQEIYLTGRIFSWYSDSCLQSTQRKLLD